VNVRGVLLDVDGTLVDSNDAHARAWVEALEESGRRVPFDRVRALIGMGGDKLLPEAAALSADSAEGEAIGRRRGAIFRERYLPHLRAFDGSRALVEDLKARGLRLAVASSAEERDLRPLLEIAGAADLLDARTSGDDAERSKPDPDIVKAALQELGCASSEAIMVGDTPYDVEAARRAGLDCIGLRCGGWSDRDLAGAVAVYDGPRDLLRRIVGSPILSG
jgi:phosphoglycolate phosphatase-like HAD superfamily hydrolase